MSMFPGGFGGPLGGDSGGDLGGAIGTPGTSGDGSGDISYTPPPAVRGRAAQVQSIGQVNAGTPGQSLWLYVVGMDELAVQAIPLKSTTAGPTWPTSLILSIEQSMDRTTSIAFATPQTMTSLATSIKVAIPITGIVWARVKVSTVGTADEYVEVTATATRTSTS